MMSDTTLMSPSLWLNDLSFVKDGLLQDCDTLSDLPLDPLNSEFDSHNIQSLTNWIPELRAPSTYQDSEVSVTNSECSDVPSIDIDNALLQNVNSTDFLSSTIINSSQQSCSLQPKLLRDGGLSDSEEEDDIWELLSTTRNPNTSEKKRIMLDDLLSANVQWSNLSREEQHQLVEDLSTAISKELGLREQLELLHILSPESNISLTDTEFVIDLNCLDDEKLFEVFTFLRSQRTGSQRNSAASKCECSHQGHKTNHHISRVGKHTQQGDNIRPENTSDNNTSCRKARKRSHKQLASRSRSKLQHKKARQQLKEQRSGLFVKEQIVAVESSEGGELDDVDILT